MMGKKERHFAPLINVSVEQLVPHDHFYRHLERTLDLTFVREFVEKTYASGGRPSIDPIVFFKLQLVMFFEDIRSERLLMRHAADRLSVRWYIGYDLNEPLPDHSSLTKIRSRYGVEVFRRFFEAIVDQSQQAGLVWGKELYVDATKVEANASMDSIKPRFAVEAHLKSLFDTEAIEPIDQAEQQKAQEEPAGSDPPVPLPVSLSPPTYEELRQHNEERHDWILEEGKPDREVIRGTYRRMADFVVSTADQDATVMPIKGQGRHLGYHTHYVGDGGKARIIMNVLVTPSEVMENQPMLDLVWRTRFRWKLWPRQVTGDTTYGTVDNIVALEQEHMRAYVPLPDFDQRTSFYGQKEFQYDPEQDVYRCPNGALLHLEKHRYTEGTKEYRADAATCNACPLKAHCTDSERGRSIRRSFDEEYLERVRAYHTTLPYQKAMRKRSVWVEPLEASGKQWHGMRRFRLRLLWRVNCEALMRAAGQNLKRLLKKSGWGQRPCPAEAVCAFFGSLLAVDTSFFGVLAFFLADEIRLLSAHERTRIHLTDELIKNIFQQAVWIIGPLASKSTPDSGQDKLCDPFFTSRLRLTCDFPLLNQNPLTCLFSPTNILNRIKKDCVIRGYKMSDINKSMRCYHCGKLAVFEVRGEGTMDGAVLDERYKDGQDITKWRILECQWCKKPTVEEIKTFYEFVIEDVTNYGWMKPVSFEINILYPETKATKIPLTNLPKEIEKEYEDTLKVREISIIACAVLARRTLEAILTYEKAEGKTLMEKIDNLIKSERIPPLLADMAHLGRKIGNLAAHFAEEKVTAEDVTIMLDFVEAILEYLYTAPVKVAAVKARLTKTS